MSRDMCPLSHELRHPLRHRVVSTPNALRHDFCDYSANVPGEGGSLGDANVDT